MACRIKGKEFMMRTPSILFMMSVSVRLSAERICPTFFSNFFHDRGVETPRGTKRRALFPHLGQKRFSDGIDEGHSCEIDEHLFSLRSRDVSPVPVQFIRPWIRQFSFGCKAVVPSVVCAVTFSIQLIELRPPCISKEN